MYSFPFCGVRHRIVVFLTCNIYALQYFLRYFWHTFNQKQLNEILNEIFEIVHMYVECRFLFTMKTLFPLGCPFKFNESMEYLYIICAFPMVPRKFVKFKIKNRIQNGLNKRGKTHLLQIKMKTKRWSPLTCLFKPIMNIICLFWA